MQSSYQLYSIVKSRMQEISRDRNFDFLFCPFMKKRAFDLISCGIEYDKLSSIICYVMTGKEPASYIVDAHAKFSYLNKMGIFP